MRKRLLTSFNQVTFKNRIFVIFLSSSLIPFICLGFLSFYTIDSILDNKVENTLQWSVHQDLITLENSLSNLNHVSQQLAYGGNMNKLMDDLQNEREPYKRIQIQSEIKSEINLISFSNPNVGLIMYYFPEKKSHDFETFRLREKFSPKKLPIMAKYPEITYFGPHKSYNGSINQYVFSTIRKINLPDQNIYLYIETGRNALQTIFAPENEKNNSRRILIINNNGRIAFSENSKVFPKGSKFTGNQTDSDSGYVHDYYWNKETSNQGWSIVSLTPIKELNHERNQWLIQITLVFIFFLVVALLFAWLMWKMVYHPLNKFNKEMKTLTKNKTIHTELTQIPEFDQLLYQIRVMKTEIWDLYREIERKEKRRADLEVEKLLYQINPHFLMNTLDTVHWLAVFSGQKEIDNLVLSLNKLLSYNLGKMGDSTTVKKELEAVHEYLLLQQVRYDFDFDVDIEADEETLEFPIPRFILQPIVENALYHGVSDNGYIHVDIQKNEKLIITVQDNGVGMTVEEVDCLLRNQVEKGGEFGMGIGLLYVKRILEAEYGSRAVFDIKSEVGKGTIVSLYIPISGGD